MTERSRYDPAWTARWYDELGAKEWERFDASAADRVSLHLHERLLREHVPPGSRVLEIGAGPGRFTRTLAALGCRVLVGDLSPVQLAEHARRAAEQGFEPAVEERRRLDVCDLSELASASFDAVVCFGGPLSYVFERAPEALAECARVCRPGGAVLASVMSLWGTLHRFLPQVLQVPPEANRRILADGDLSPDNWAGVTHRCHLFRAEELRGLAAGAGLEVLSLSASAFVSLLHEDGLPDPAGDPAGWAELLSLEEAACASPGATEAGPHLLLAARRAPA